jgi:hypothetical protein
MVCVTGSYYLLFLFVRGGAGHSSVYWWRQASYCERVLEVWGKGSALPIIGPLGSKRVLLPKHPQMTDIHWASQVHLCVKVFSNKLAFVDLNPLQSNDNNLKVPVTWLQETAVLRGFPPIQHSSQEQQAFFNHRGVTWNASKPLHQTGQ